MEPQSNSYIDIYPLHQKFVSDYLSDYTPWGFAYQVLDQKSGHHFNW